MIAVAAAVQNVEAEARWQAWQLRGAKADRDRASAVRVFMTAVALMLAGWLLFELG